MLPLPAKEKGRPEADTIWVSALSVAAGVARKASSNERDVIRAVAEELRRLKLRGTVALLTPDGQLQVQTRSLSPTLESSLKKLTGYEIAGYTFDPNSAEVYSTALSTGKAVFTEDRVSTVKEIMPQALHPLLPRIMKLLGDDKVIVAPLIFEDEPIGTINVSAHWLTVEDAPFVEALADHVAIALGQVRNRHKLELALEQQRLRNTIAELLARAVDMNEVMETVLRACAEATGADSGTIGLIEPNKGTIYFPYIYGKPEETDSHPTPRGEGAIWTALNQRSPLLINDYPNHPDATQSAIDAGIKSVIGIPLIVGDETIGIMGVFNHSDEVKFTQDHVEQTEAITSMAAIAIKKALLYEEANKSAEESKVLIRTARTISASLDADTVLHEIAMHANNLLEADGSRIHLADYEEGVIRCVVALEPNAEAISSFELKLGQGLTGEVIRTGEPLIINNPSEDTRSVQVPNTPDDELECLAIVPLSIRQRTMGSMTVRRMGLERPFTIDDLDLLMAFGAQAAISIENAHLYGQIESQAQRLEAEVIERTRELALSESRYRGLVETAQAGIFQLDTTGRITYANQTLADMADIPLNEIIGQPFTKFDLIPAETTATMMAQFEARLRGELSPQAVFEFEFFSRSGRRIPTLIGISLITDAEGNPQGITGLVTDISERIALEKALEAERDRLNALLTNIGDAVMVTDRDGIIQFVNPAWERQTGYSADEALGEEPSILRSEEFDTKSHAVMMKSVRAGETWRGEVTNRRKDGSEYEAEISLTPVLGPTLEAVDFVTVMHDISARKEIDRLKSQFVSDVSHELRTPLTNIRLYLDLMDRIRDKEKVTRYLKTLTRESERLSNLIDDLLSLSSLDVDATPIRTADVDINTILESLAIDRRSLAASQGLSLELELHDNLPPIAGDSRLIGQIFTNLLTNAMNYTPEGGVITLRTRLDRENGDNWMVVEVEDTGLGIPLSEQADIFNRFYRGEASKSTGAPGTGLGLAICEEIVSRHGGRIAVASEGIPGKGSCFSVWLRA